MKIILFIYLISVCPIIYPDSFVFWNYSENQEGVEWHSAGDFEKICISIYKYIYDLGYERIGDISWHRTFGSKYFWGGVFENNGHIIQIAVVSPVFKNRDYIAGENAVISIVIENIRMAEKNALKGFFTKNEGDWSPDAMVNLNLINDNLIKQIYKEELYYVIHLNNKKN